MSEFPRRHSKRLDKKAYENRRPKRGEWYQVWYWGLGRWSSPMQAVVGRVNIGSRDYLYAELPEEGFRVWGTERPSDAEVQ